MVKKIQKSEMVRFCVWWVTMETVSLWGWPHRGLF